MANLFVLLFHKLVVTSISLPQVSALQTSSRKLPSISNGIFFYDTQMANSKICLQNTNIFLQFLLKVKMTFFYLFNTIMLTGLAFLIFLSRQSKEKGLPLDIFSKITQPGTHNSRKNPQMSFCLVCLNFIFE